MRKDDAGKLNAGYLSLACFSKKVSISCKQQSIALRRPVEDSAIINSR